MGVHGLLWCVWEGGRYLLATGDGVGEREGAGAAAGGGARPAYWRVKGPSAAGHCLLGGKVTGGSCCCAGGAEEQGASSSAEPRHWRGGGGGGRRGAGAAAQRGYEAEGRNAPCRPAQPGSGAEDGAGMPGVVASVKRFGTTAEEEKVEAIIAAADSWWSGAERTPQQAARARGTQRTPVFFLSCGAKSIYGDCCHDEQSG